MGTLGGPKPFPPLSQGHRETVSWSHPSWLNSFKDLPVKFKFLPGVLSPLCFTVFLTDSLHHSLPTP